MSDSYCFLLEFAWIFYAFDRTLYSSYVMEILAAHYQDFPQRRLSTYHAQTAQSRVFLVVQCYAQSCSSILFMED